MEQFVEFLSSTWGYLLIGGIVVALIIILSLVGYKFIKTDKTKLKTINELMNDLREKKEQTKEQIITDQANQAYFNEIVSVVFKLLTYIVMASKLTEGTKIELADIIKGIGRKKYEEILKEIAEHAQVKVEEIKEEIPEVVETVEETIKQTETLLDKYK